SPTPTVTVTGAPTLTPSVTPTPGSYTVYRIEGSDAAITSPSTHFQGNFLSPSTGSSVNATMGVFNTTTTVDLGGWYNLNRVTLTLYRPPSGNALWAPFEAWNAHTNIYTACGQLIASFTTAGFAGTFTTVAINSISVITNKIIISRAPGETGGARLLLDYIEVA